MAVSGRIVKLPATGYVAKFLRDDMHLYAKSGASTTALSCQPYATLPPGLQFILDNSNGGGSMTMTPSTGTATVVTTGKVYQYTVSAAGTLKAVELAAAPT